MVLTSDWEAGEGNGVEQARSVVRPCGLRLSILTSTAIESGQHLNYHLFWVCTVFLLYVLCVVNKSLSVRKEPLRVILSSACNFILHTIQSQPTRWIRVSSRGSAKHRHRRAAGSQWFSLLFLPPSAMPSRAACTPQRDTVGWNTLNVGSVKGHQQLLLHVVPLESSQKSLCRALLTVAIVLVDQERFSEIRTLNNFKTLHPLYTNPIYTERG